MTHSELAYEFADVFDEMNVDEINQVLAQNVPFETLEFFNTYGEAFGRAEKSSEETRKRLPNLLVLGYLLRVLEERLLEDDDETA